MTTTGWTHDESPFHPGEQALQTRAGTRDKLETLGRRVIRDHLPEQHQRFYAELAYLFVGSVDADGRPWASIVTGQPGFVTTPDDKGLAVAATPLPGDPLAQNLREGAPLGLLGLDFARRRRNRANGRVAVLDEDGISLTLDQSFGNCPKYIKERHCSPAAEWTPGEATRSRTLSDGNQALIRSAETFFIATTNPGDGPTGGIDVSHRGGRPGFVDLEDNHTLVFPDFSGNNHFNTFGNLAVDPRAGLLFIDFERGDVLYLTGRAEVVWDPAEVARFDGAERLVRFTLEESIQVPGALPIRFSDGATSPFLEDTGSW